MDIVYFSRVINNNESFQHQDTHVVEVQQDNNQFKN